MFDFLLWESNHIIKIQLNVDVHKYYYYLVKTLTEVIYSNAQSQISRPVSF